MVCEDIEGMEWQNFKQRGEFSQLYSWEVKKNQPGSSRPPGDLKPDVLLAVIENRGSCAQL